jgi:hypothetical protein
MRAAVSSVVASSIVSETRPDVSISVEAISVIAQSDRIRTAVASVVGAASAVYQIPASAIDYIEIDVATALDEEGWYKLYQDSAVILDQKAIDFAKQLLDQALATDDPALHLEKALDDSVSTADAVTILIIILRTFADTASTSDDSSFSLAKALADVATTVDAKAVDFEKARSDAVTALDVALRSVSKGLADAAAANDVNAIAFAKAASDSATTADVAARDVSKVLSDSTALADSALLDFAKALSDLQPAADALSRVVDWYRDFNDAPITSDALEVAFSKALADTYGATDAAQLSLSKALVDSVSTADSLSYQIQSASPQLLNTYVLNFFVLNGP